MVLVINTDGITGIKLVNGERSDNASFPPWHFVLVISHSRETVTRHGAAVVDDIEDDLYQSWFTENSQMTFSEMKN